MDLHPFSLEIVYNNKLYSGEELYDTWLKLGFIDLLSSFVNFIINLNNQTDFNLYYDETLDFGYLPLKKFLNYQISKSLKTSIDLIADYYNSWTDLEHFGEGINLLDFITETPEDLICLNKLSYLVASLMCNNIWFFANYSSPVLQLIRGEEEFFYNSLEKNFKKHFMNTNECFRDPIVHRNNVTRWGRFLKELKVPNYSNILDYCDNNVEYKKISEYRKPCPCHSGTLF